MPSYPAYNYPNFQQQYGMPQMPVNSPMTYFTPQMQQQIQQQQANVLNGKIVENIDNVKLTDIPMDGNSFYFPKADGTEIYTKRWLANGSTEVAVYKRFFEESEEQTEKFNFGEMEGNIMDKLNAIDERISKIEKGLIPKAAAKVKEA